MTEKQPPKFKSFEEMQRYLDKQESKPEKKKGSRSPKKKNTPAEPDPMREPNREGIWQTIHYYVDAAHNWNVVLAAAKEERGYRNENVLVFAHKHEFSEACDASSCREILLETEGDF